MDDPRQLIEQGRYEELANDDHPLWCGLALLELQRFPQAAHTFEEAPDAAQSGTRLGDQRYVLRGTRPPRGPTARASSKSSTTSPKASCNPRRSLESTALPRMSRSSIRRLRRLYQGGARSDTPTSQGHFR